jgi:heterogeneous nuclear rnp K-like protein 2
MDESEDNPPITSLRLILPAIFATPLTRPTYPLLSQIQHETSCTLALSPSVLPLSTESLLVIQGPLLGVTAAVQKISEYLHSSYEHYAAIQNGAKPPVVTYVPLPVYGTLGSPENYDLPRVIQARMMTPQNPYGMDPKIPMGQPVAAAAAVAQVPQQQAVGPQAGQVYQQAPTQSVQGPTVGAPQGIQPAVVGPGGQMTQQIFIPNDMVGAIIGKGGAKINEIRQMSGSHMYVPVPLLSRFVQSANVCGVVRSMNLLRTAMSDLSRSRGHRSAIRWRYICYTNDWRRRSTGCRATIPPSLKNCRMAGL